MKTILFAGFFAFQGLLSFAQTGAISGRVIDAQTLEPMPFANVFIINTTIGSSTDLDGTFTLAKVPTGAAEVMYSFVGYQSYQARVTVKDGESVRVNIKLIPLQQQLDEVQVKAKRDKAWEKQLKKFEKIFFGNDALATECSILNAYVIDFSETDNKFTAKALAPIEIRNNALGYHVTYFLKDFKADGLQYSIIGNSRFDDLPASTAEQARTWMKNRETAYLGSARHLFKSILEDKVNENGFRLYTDRAGANTARLPSFKQDLEKSTSVVPYKVNGLIEAGASMYEKKILFKGRVEVHFIEKQGALQIYRDIGHQVSWVEVKNEYVVVTNDGISLNSKDVVISGDMMNARLSNSLPLDYQPKSVIRIRTKDQLTVERLFETTYLQTSKPYYYPGELIWVKGYMDYSVRGMADTLSRVLYVDVVNSERRTVLSKTLRIDSGRVAGEIRIPAIMKPGTYMLVAYTNWMRNYGESSYFKKIIPVLDIYDKVIPAAAPKSIKNTDDLELTFDKETYGLRDKVIANIILTENNLPVKGNFSVSVTDQTQIPDVDWSAKDIRKDLVIPQDFNAASGFSHRVEYGVTVKGEFITDTKKSLPADVTAIRGTFEEVHKIKTSPEGSFSIVDLDILDSAAYSFQALRAKESFGQFKISRSRDHVLVSFPPALNIPLERKSEMQGVLSNYEIPKDATLLSNVDVKATRLLDPERQTPNAYGKGEVVISGEDISRYGSIETLLRGKSPNYRLDFDGIHWMYISTRPQKMLSGIVTSASGNSSERGGGFRTSMRGAIPEPALAVNNRIIQMGPDETVGDYLMRMIPETIERIEISSTGASYIGSMGENGLISVFTRKNGAPDRKTFQEIYIKGFDTPNRFTGPDYSDKAEDHSQGDFRSTLYWNNNLRAYSDGKGQFSFYTSDLPGKYRVVIEGMTQKGKKVRYETFLVVEDK
ncbi:MAG TPA: carboxypeptidase-like regulatory domain-containing protein [Cyclobacteriaceae bacterium]|nr:carboxypeptidase-like regulatory domain-containing protein [Cyclobacteriaceae bacterium]